MSKMIGYMEGTDALWLTSLQILEYDTLPLSNGWDGHGMNILQLSPQQHVDVVVGYLHKIMPPKWTETTAQELLHATKVYDIPVLIVCPKADHATARQRIGHLPSNVTLVDPSAVLETIKKTTG